MKYTAKTPETNVNITPTSPLLDFFVLLFGVVAIIVGIYFFLGLAVDFFVPRLSMNLEQKMAGPFLHTMAGADHSSRKAQSVQKLLNALQKHCTKPGYRFTVYLLKQNTVNALALPGGNIIVFSELLKKTESENELAFVLAHEMGHYKNRDHLKRLGRGIVFMMISAALFGPNSRVGNLLANALNMAEMGFSRHQETLADEFAMDVLQCYYGHVDGSVAFFKKLDKKNDLKNMGHYFSDHPENQKRIAHLIDYSRNKGYKFKKMVR